ncbi:DUF4362 domain-containing protein [Cohnella sp. REN36]|uniref:DUF4362 domain-containing protein n=1 Tax=Cohnella sp. REN36 TaxID=2887347 RepID=UPI001D15CBD8|nr:DUF4362 domain-containing protein [Cohnella sp. REN36]MCC3375968.1 DUF4362 domain-containing protein [Cohnella sp. REN36]
MRKRVWGAAAVLLLLCGGCMPGVERAQAPASGVPKTAAPSAQKTFASSDQVVVSRSLAFGKVSEKTYGIFAGQEDVRAFEEAIRTGERIQGVLDVVEPDYDAVVAAGGRQEIHLWLDAKADIGMFTFVSDTGTGYRLTAEATRELRDRIWGLRYDPELAERNGDVVNLHGKVANADEWERFAEHVAAGVPDEVQVVSYTIEGGPIFDNLSYDGQAIRHRYDNTHDAYGTPVKQTTFCEKLSKTSEGEGTAYTLASCDRKENGFRMVMP